MSPTDHGPGATRTTSEHAWFVRLLLGLVVLFVAALLGFNGPERSDGTEVEVDGQPHTVEVVTYRPTVVYAADLAEAPTCRITDPDSGAPLSSASSRSADRDGLQAFQEFTPSSDTVVVTCSDGAGTVTVASENPGAPYLVARYGGAALLLLIGIALLASSARLVARQRSA